MDNAGVTRKLAVILAADVAGYSRLMAADEEGTLAMLNVHRRVIDELIGRHHGRIFSTAGDSVMAEFASAVEAVRCAAAIQRETERGNADLPEPRRMLFRVGVNLGDVMVSGDNLFGDGVNVAARLESAAEPGGICISSAVHDQIRNKVDLGFEDLGERSLKNIGHPVRVFGLRREAPAEPGPLSERPAVTRPSRPSAFPSIAVLPFANFGGDPEQEYFADGITEDLITELSRFQEIRVIARNSVMTYKGRPARAQEVGRELGVRYVLEGSVRKAGERVRITAQLIDATTDHHLWAERFDRDLADIFEVQDEVTSRIVATLAGKLVESERRRVRSARTGNLEAYDCVLRGRELWERFTLEDNREARRLYEKAIELDPDYARAYASLAWTYLVEHSERWAGAEDQPLERALEYARQGVMVNRASHSNHLVLGQVCLSKGLHDEALEALETAIALNPNDADGYAFLARALAFAGRPDEAIELIGRAQRLNPAAPRWYAWNLGMALYLARRHDDAVTAFRKATPLGDVAYRWLAAAYAQLGREQDAKAAAEAYLKLTPDFSIGRHLEVLQFQHAEDREHYAEGLRKAGLPE
ncbi:MAG: adenylate/guanylate cyclase domain-containing protein [Geminicoccaceae bacterium]